jgi:hypothetical protein
VEEPSPGSGSWKARAKEYSAPAALAFCLLFSIVMAVFHPVPHGHRYDLCFGLTLRLTIIWVIYRVVPGWIFRKGLPLAILVFGLIVGSLQLATVDPDGELVHFYGSAFTAMQSGQNPYTSGTIYHRAEFKKVVSGDFNYPPMELYPYYAAYRLAGRWDSRVLTGTMVLLQALACLVFLFVCSKVKPIYLLPFSPFFILEEIHVNPAMTLFVTGLILWALRKSRERPLKRYRYLVAVLFGVGLMTKFLIIPLAAAYYANALGRREARKLLDVALEAGTTVGTALLLMTPFGIGPVFKNTILFNLVLKDRDALTTFFPNVLSGLMSWLKMGAVYPVLAVAIFAASVWVASKLNVFSALLTAAFTFLLVAPIPRSQFTACLLYIAVAGIVITFGERGALPPKVLRKHAMPILEYDSRNP